VLISHGDLFAEGINVDLLVISAREDFYEPEAGSMVSVLLKTCGLVVGDLRRSPAVDLTQAPTIRAWITPDLESLPTKPRWPDGSRTRFKRLAVIETPDGAQQEDNERPVFQQMFCLLALLPMHGIQCNSVATPLLNTGRQKAKPKDLYPALIQAVGSGFRHVPDLQQLIIFDLKQENLEELSKEIDQALDRSPLQRERLRIREENQDLIDRLLSSLYKFKIEQVEAMQDPEVEQFIAGIEHQLRSPDITLVTLGINARKLLEKLVARRLRGRCHGINLYGMITLLAADISAWSLNAIHTVRIFGNWMGHASEEIEPDQLPKTPVCHDDMRTMLLAFQRVLEDYPWARKARKVVPIKRIKLMT
jgi:signal transduction histidine kinase